MHRASPVDYAISAGGHVAFRTCGTGPPDLVLINDWFSHVGDQWRDDSPVRPVLDRFASFGRIITFDKRGVGLSDPLPLGELPTLEEWADDVRAVLQATGSEEVTLVGKGSGGPLAIVFAATHPDRVASLVLINAWARLSQDEDFPIGVPPRAAERMLATTYMPPEAVERLAGDRSPPGFVDWWEAYVRSCASPSTTQTMRRWLMELDARAALPSVACPTLVIARRDAWIGSDHARYLVEHIPDARLVERPGSADFLFTGDTEVMLDEIEAFVTGARPRPAPDRVLATVLFTDIVDSTTLAARLGDRRWTELLDRHDQIVRGAVAAGSGTVVKSTGDGVLATFDGPARAIRTAAMIRDSLGGIGITVRSGLHAGELEVRDDGDIGGIAAHIGARIEALAGPGEIMVSRTVRDLVVGSGIAFADRGVHHLKGVPDEWPVYALAE
jgi:pimeloyl-ACP methyl ester carboxylesterase